MCIYIGEGAKILSTWFLHGSKRHTDTAFEGQNPKTLCATPKKWKIGYVIGLYKYPEQNLIQIKTMLQNCNCLQLKKKKFGPE